MEAANAQKTISVLYLEAFVRFNLSIFRRKGSCNSTSLIAKKANSKMIFFITKTVIALSEIDVYASGNQHGGLNRNKSGNTEKYSIRRIML